jgi:hypothetical protein
MNNRLLALQLDRRGLDQSSLPDRPSGAWKYCFTTRNNTSASRIPY